MVGASATGSARCATAMLPTCWWSTATRGQGTRRARPWSDGDAL